MNQLVSSSIIIVLISTSCLAAPTEKETSPAVPLKGDKLIEVPHTETSEVAKLNQKAAFIGLQPHIHHVGKHHSKVLRSAYGGPAIQPAYAPAPKLLPSLSYPAPLPSMPCPKNVLISCTPQVIPVPCSAPAQPYLQAGAYSEPVPQYATFES